MNSYHGPLWITVPGLAEQITQVVKNFAKKESLEYEALYHDEPIWFVRKDEEGITQRVQIAAFNISFSEQLCFIPDAYSFDEPKEEMTVVPPELSNKYIICENLKDLVNESSRYDKLIKLLDQAWSSAIKFNRKNLSYPIKIPPKLSKL